MKQLIFVFLTQFLLTAGSLIAAGLFIHLCKQLLVQACGKYAPQIVNYSGIIGTPVHELSHAAMCLVFGHKIKKIKLFGIDKRNGTLGYVQHSFNPRNLWQRIGNFFIGIAPVLAGSGVLLLLLRLFLPATFTRVLILLANTADGSLNIASFAQLGRTVLGLFELLFAPDRLHSWKLWVFLVLATTIAIHMDLSVADIKGGWNGLLFYVAALLAVDIPLYFLNPEWLAGFTGAIVRGGFLLTSLLLLSVVFAGIVGIFSLAVLALKRLLAAF